MGDEPTGKRVLVIGSGGREHAIAWKLAQSPAVSEVFCAPGNAGTVAVGENVNISPDDFKGLTAFAKEKGIALTVVGPEGPLAEGIVDYFEEEGLAAFGPGREAARLEASKAFAKEFMKRHGIPTAAFRSFSTPDEAKAYVRRHGGDGVVVKASGLAAGKGVIVCHTVEEAIGAVDQIMVDAAFGAAGQQVVVEELLEGEELSVLAFCDGNSIVPMVASQDHKQAFEGDQGPNTGGMGAYSPAPAYTAEVREVVERDILGATVSALRKEGIPYQGVLYAGLMLTAAGPKVLEFNVRFGDPETQALLARFDGDLFQVMEACCRGTLDPAAPAMVRWKDDAAVCVIMASGGYPGPYERGKVISGLDTAGALDDVVIFHAGTAKEGDRIVTAGGRVLGVTALGDTIEDAIERAYRATGMINFDGMRHRNDIGHKALSRAAKG